MHSIHQHTMAMASSSLRHEWANNDGERVLCREGVAVQWGLGSRHKAVEKCILWIRNGEPNQSTVLQGRSVLRTSELSSHA
jgi:hypothetical protein